MSKKQFNKKIKTKKAMLSMKLHQIIKPYLFTKKVVNMQKRIFSMKNIKMIAQKCNTKF